MFMQDQESSAVFRAGQAVVDRGKLFQMPSQRRGNKRQSGRIGRDETLDFRGIGRRERSPRRLRSSILRFTDRQAGVCNLATALLMHFDKFFTFLDQEG